jgi:type I restriction enzyme S subunit
MSENNLKPKIRFTFSDDWEESEFLNAFTTLQNNTLSRAELNYEKGSAKCVHYGDVLIKFGECLDVNNEKLPFISDDTIVTKYKASFLQNGDVIMADAAEDETVGKCCEIVGLDNQILISGLHTIPFRPIEAFATGYLGYYMNSSAYHNQLLPLMQGTKVSSVSKSALRDTIITYPKSIDEQLKIGAFFKDLDNLIALHQYKYDKLINIKKAMLEKMFPKNGSKVPEIRFKGFAGDWEAVELGKVCTISTGYPFNSNDFDKNGTYLVITNGNIQDEQSIVNNSVGNRINISDKKILDEYVLDIKNILVTMDGTVGRTAKVANFKQILAQRVGRIIADKNSEFIYQLLNTGLFIKEMSLISHGGTIKHISLSDIGNYLAVLPSSESEQQRIGTFFKNLDNLITLHQSKYDKLVNIKKAMLEKMFV